MWRPRRVLLLLCGILLFGGVYWAYAHFLGWLDGLPQLPARFLEPQKDQPPVPVRVTSPTVQRLIEAFGPNCPESQDNKVYETKLEFRKGESSVVLACGPPPSNPNSKWITLSPFSVAVFGKPRPDHLRQPGEVVEISTFHSDKAILEFDRVITNPNDMSKAKLLRLELVSDPEVATPDPRRGKVHVTNNQKSADPNKYLILRTPGPVFYRDPKYVDPKAAEGPDIWTDAAVEIIDRQNLPRPYGAPSPPTAQARGDELREGAAVPDILAGRRLPPPTVTGLGMRIFLIPDPKTQPQPTPKKETAVTGNVRRVELQEKVLINLWVDPGSGLVSSPGSGERKSAGPSPLAVPQPPAATGAVVGGVFFAVQTARQLDRALLQVETLGPFAYDAEKNLARFDVVPQSSPNLPNDVQVTRILPRGGRDQLFTQVLEIEFNGPPTGSQTQPGQPQPPRSGGPSFKRLHAWAYTPGRFITLLHGEERRKEQLEAYGQKLVHEQATNRTVLTGAPLYAVRSNAPRADGRPAGRNILSAGTPQRPASFILETPSGAAQKTTVEGPGRLELFDPASNGNTIHATWQTSLVHSKEVVNRLELDLFTFTDGASFADVGADYWLKGNVLKLWLEPGRRPDAVAEAPPAGEGTGSGSMLPHRVQALGDVTGHSADFDIESAEHLNVMFRDGLPDPAPPKPVSLIPPPPMAVAPMGTPAAGPPPPAAPAPPKEPAKPKPPMKLRARIIDTWVVRYPAQPAPKKDAAVAAKADAKRDEKPPERAGEGSVRYQLEQARCEDKVVVHQDPSEPDKPRGVDIFGQAMLVDHTPDGSVLTVTGTDAKPGEVHYETMSIIGPKVVIDQLHNLAAVEGRGALSMPAGTDFSGTALKRPEVMVVHWRDKMEFSGAKKAAKFDGKVVAVQGDGWVQCHTMLVTLDRPVYFNQLRRPGDPPPAPKADRPVPSATPADPKAAAKDRDNPRIDKVNCYPAPEDARDEVDAYTVKFHQVERDRDTNAVVKTQFLQAKELELNAQAQDQDGRGERYQQVVAHGPGVVRIWQPGQKDPIGPGPDPNPNPAPKADPRTPAKPADNEMKLTVVTFAGRMIARDKAKIYQDAVFYQNVEVINIPANSPEAAVDRFRLPVGAVRLTCADRLIVTSYKQGNAPPAQTMRAEGNAYIRSDEYDGWGETITSDGRLITLHGGPTALASIKSRFKQNDSTGKTIIYDRLKGEYSAKDSFGGTIQPGSLPTPAPPKK